MPEFLSAYKPLLTALVLPPASLILLVLVGARLILPRRVLGFTLVLAACLGLWLTSTSGFARVLQQFVLRTPPAWTQADIEALRKEVKAQPRGRTEVAIVVLGGGMKPRAPEYGVSDLTPASHQRLRYGVWLARATGAPLGFSGGLGWSQLDGETPEARIAERLAQEEFGLRLRWVEDLSRDTHENAARTAALLRSAGVRKVVIVTHAWHMPRALRSFREVVGNDMQVVGAPMGFHVRRTTPALEWLPSSEGLYENRVVLRELLAWLIGA